MPVLKVFSLGPTLINWNHIPLSIREIDSLTEFKSKLTKYMWENIMSEISTDEVNEINLSETYADELV